MSEPMLTGNEVVCPRNLEHGPHATTAQFCCMCGKPLVMFLDAMCDLNNLRFAMENFRLEHEDTPDGYTRVPQYVAAKMLDALEEAS